MSSCCWDVVFLYVSISETLKGFLDSPLPQWNSCLTPLDASARDSEQYFLLLVLFLLCFLLNDPYVGYNSLCVFSVFYFVICTKTKTVNIVNGDSVGRKCV